MSPTRARLERDAQRLEHLKAGGGCDLCGAKPGEKGLCGATAMMSLHWDHDHGTQKHRGWLCQRANRMLWAWVTPAWLRAAADYLEGRT